LVEVNVHYKDIPVTGIYELLYASRKYGWPVIFHWKIMLK